MKNVEKVQFDDGVLSTIFFHELRWLCANIKRNTDNLFETCKVPDEGFVIQVDPEMHSVISSILTDAANIKKLSVTAGAKLNGENSERYQMRLGRAKAIESFLKNIGLIEMHKVKVRNTLEHFDEYLDESNLELTKKPKGTRAAYNMIISHWEVTQPRLYPIRLYVSSERKFYNMKWVVDIGKLADEAVAILNKFSTEKTFGHEADPGGLMINV
ncbi:hypothetical protein [Pseudomonas brassicacearum]|uniref:Uncharacterized protein n=1 Tax=Pseudomonas brassicacearum TaxID=930166 RepID=A0A423GP21_9PSED|nr:hypothetical protein [Pseudomonas brassicacearum]ROM94435.1 hypothetical protein BK658_17945 [Pseudomonas brassicacearum]